MQLLLLWAFVRAAPASESFDGHTFYFGDLHAHTGLSPDGGSYDLGNCDDMATCLSLSDALQTAKANALDFVAFTDHSTSDEAGYNGFLTEVIAATDDTFVTIPSMELRFFYPDGSKVGHKNIYVFQDDNDALAGLSLAELAMTEDITDCQDIWDHADYIAATYGPTLVWAHHPANPRFPTDWSCHSDKYEPVVEPYSGVGNSLDADSDFDPIESGTVETGTVRYALAEGLEVGFVGGTDIHDTRPGAVCATCTQHTESHIFGGGLTMIALPDGASFTRKSIYDELVARRSLETSGPEIPVFVHWTTPDTVAHAIGEDIALHGTASESTTVSVKIPTTVPTGSILGVRAVGDDTTSFDLVEDTDAAGEWSVTIPNDQLTNWLYVEVAIDGAAYYPDTCADGGDDDREFVWASPVWFHPSSDLDGDGYAYDSGDCDDYNAAIHPGAFDVWRNGIDENCDGHDRRVKAVIH
jgi:hypothetical protein